MTTTACTPSGGTSGITPTKWYYGPPLRVTCAITLLSWRVTISMTKWISIVGANFTRSIMCVVVAHAGLLPPGLGADNQRSTDPNIGTGLFDIWLNHNFTGYAQSTASTTLTLKNWIPTALFACIFARMSLPDLELWSFPGGAGSSRSLCGRKLPLEVIRPGDGHPRQ